MLKQGFCEHKSHLVFATMYLCLCANVLPSNRQNPEGSSSSGLVAQTTHAPHRDQARNLLSPVHAHCSPSRPVYGVFSFILRRVHMGAGSACTAAGPLPCAPPALCLKSWPSEFGSLSFIVVIISCQSCSFPPPLWYCRVQLYGWCALTAAC